MQKNIEKQSSRPISIATEIGTTKTMITRTTYLTTKQPQIDGVMTAL